MCLKLEDEMLLVLCVAIGGLKVTPNSKAIAMEIVRGEDLVSGFTCNHT